MVFSRLARLIVCCMSVASLSGAAHIARAEEDAAALIRGKLRQARPELAIEKVRPSVAPGLYEVHLSAGPILYSTADGDFFVLGDLFSVGVGGVVNIAEQHRDRMRKELIAGVEREDMIIFASRGETLGAVTVFTDVDCIYCQKLHREVPAMNRAGIEVRYLAYPRAGVGSAGYRKIASAWCSADPREAITALKNRETIPENVCPGNPVADHFALGHKAGVRGTPALVLESGAMLPGYLSADDLARRMKID